MDNYNKIIHKNINKLLNKSSISENNLINLLSKHINRQDVLDFFNCKTGCSDRLLIALSKYFKMKEEHSDLDSIDNSKQENIVKLQKLLQLEEVEISDNPDRMLLDFTKQALKKDLISISYAAYILNIPVSEIMELNIE